MASGKRMYKPSSHRRSVEYASAPADHGHWFLRTWKTSARLSLGLLSYSVTSMRSSLPLPLRIWVWARNNTAPLRLDWAPPPPQGQTLRERVERRERQVRLRCCAPSCRVGPSDENLSADAHRSIRLLHIGLDGACTHIQHRRLITCFITILRRLLIVGTICHKILVGNLTYRWVMQTHDRWHDSLNDASTW
ncbi:hypothetical protein B0H14DRAFT_3463576 [Mycena olivaceomarginata]|nr:hypothetical protein B0H14DRAFT_3463576 [Mycena olivaceomarginata]